MKKLHQLTDDQIYEDWRDLVAKNEKLADFAIIGTQDQDHKEPAVALAKQGYHLLLEKPMSINENECDEIAKACDEAKVMLCVCHVLRYTEMGH